MTHHWGYVSAIASAILFGISSALNKIALENVNPMIVAGTIYLVGGVLLFGVHLSPLHRKILSLFKTPTETETKISKKIIGFLLLLFYAVQLLHLFCFSMVFTKLPQLTHLCSLTPNRCLLF